MADQEAVDSFCAITGASAAEAKFYLDSSGGEVDAAISSFYDHAESAGAATSDALGPGDAAPEATTNAMVGSEREAGDEVEQTRAGAVPRSAAAGGLGPAGSAGLAGGRSGQAGGRAGARGSGRSSGNSKIRSLSDVKARGGNDDDDDDDDDDGPQEYYTGGEKSGMMVQDPNRRGRRGPTGAPGASPLDADRLMDLARQQGAREGMPGELEAAHHQGGARGDGFGAFTGQARRLGGAGEAEHEPPAAAPAVPAPAAASAQPRRHIVHLYRNGFTVDNGPLRGFQDPANASFLNSLMRGEYPSELAKLSDRDEGEVDLVRVNEDYQPPPKPKYVAFSGQGHTLNTSTTPSQSEPPAAAPLSAGGLPSAETARAEAPGLLVDDSKPVTSIQLRLADGTRMVARFNLTHTVGDIRRFIDSSRPGATRAAYTLQAPGFPPKKLDNNEDTIEAAGLVNSVVIQR